tara:strand:+ start:3994 stop:4536 length:543 start_codon:yes stop_codon:yes gene_type:complete
MEETKLTEPTMAEENKNKKEVVKYQWVKGEHFGSIVIKAENQKDDKWLYFEDGSRINPELVDEFLLKIERPNQIFDVSQVGINPTATPTPTVTETPTPIDEPTIMGKLIMKMSKKNVVNVPVQININIPTGDLYNMLSGGMEEEDLNEEILAVALQQIEINNLQAYIKENVSQFLKEYYS